MSQEYILEVQGVSKYYKTAGKKTPFIALNDVSFKIRKGESVGLVGKNGSGKSTLLKIISGIVTPSNGEVTVRGKLISLIELGGGMHPDLTGKENIFLYGALLGISKKELIANYQNIVTFSELEDFIHQPLCNYSSGMAMRLGFSVATCVRPDLLLVDEVLSVGDQKFRQKCLKRITKYIQEGTSLVMVHHHFGLVASYCDRGLLLDEGSVIVNNRIDELAKVYLRNDAPESVCSTIQLPKDSPISSAQVEVTNANGERRGTYYRNEEIQLIAEIEIKENQALDFVLGLHIFDGDNTQVFPILVQLKSEKDLTGGNFIVKSKIPSGLLNSVSYRISFAVSTVIPTHVMHFLKEDALRINVNENLEDRETSYLGKIAGVIRPNIETTISKRD